MAPVTAHYVCSPILCLFSYAGIPSRPAFMTFRTLQVDCRQSRQRATIHKAMEGSKQASVLFCVSLVLRSSEDDMSCVIGCTTGIAGCPGCPGSSVPFFPAQRAPIYAKLRLLALCLTCCCLMVGATVLLSSEDDVSCVIGCTTGVASCCCPGCPASCPAGAAAELAGPWADHVAGV